MRRDDTARPTEKGIGLHQLNNNFLNSFVQLNNDIDIHVCQVWWRRVPEMLSLALVLGPWLSLRTKLQSLVLALAMNLLTSLESSR